MMSCKTQVPRKKENRRRKFYSDWCQISTELETWLLCLSDWSLCSSNGWATSKAKTFKCLWRQLCVPFCFFFWETSTIDFAYPIFICIKCCLILEQGCKEQNETMESLIEAAISKILLYFILQLQMRKWGC